MFSLMTNFLSKGRICMTFLINSSARNDLKCTFHPTTREDLSECLSGASTLVPGLLWYILYILVLGMDVFNKLNVYITFIHNFS